MVASALSVCVEVPDPGAVCQVLNRIFTLGQNSVVKKKSPRAAVSALWLTYPIAWDPYQPVGGSESLSSGSGGRNLIVGAVSVR